MDDFPKVVNPKLRDNASTFREVRKGLNAGNYFPQ